MAKHLAVKPSSSAEKIIRQGHPWVYADSISKISGDGKAGDLAILFGHQSNKVFAIGLFDPDSPIRIKIIHHGDSQKIDSDFFKQKIAEAFELRKPLLDGHTNAWRLIFGENDGFPGLIADIYDEVAVIKIYSAAWYPYIKIIAGHIAELSGARAVVLRLSRNLQKSEAPFAEGEVLSGKLKDPEVYFTEYGVHFKANVLLGHKTGFFLDHRANRHKIGMLSKGKTVLDVFCYAGGFSIHALAGGAKEVTSLDISKQALQLAVENARLNRVKGKHHIMAGDAFENMKKLIHQQKKFDVVVIDPPSFAKSKNEKSIAIKKYRQLASLGVSLTKKGGLLMLASCSSQVSEEEFREAHKSVFLRLDTNFTLEEFTRHDIDHPIKFPEGAYLKSAYYRIK